MPGRGQDPFQAQPGPETATKEQAAKSKDATTKTKEPDTSSRPTRMGETADPRTVHGHPDEGHRARLLRQVLSRPFQGDFPLRLLRRQAVRREDQVRVGHRLAQLLEPDQPQGRGSRPPGITASPQRPASRSPAAAAAPTSATSSRTARPTGLRYCINSAALRLDSEKATRTATRSTTKRAPRTQPMKSTRKAALPKERCRGANAKVLTWPGPKLAWRFEFVPSDAE